MYLISLAREILSSSDNKFDNSDIKDSGILINTPLNRVEGIRK